MSNQIINLTVERFINHKNDKILKEYKCENSNINIYITKIYKIVKIETKNLIYIMYFNSFFEILLSSYLRNNLKNYSYNLKHFKIMKNIRNFVVFYKNNEIFDFSYSKSKIIINDVNYLYKSIIFNSKQLCHIENKKKELYIIFKQFDKFLLNNKTELFSILNNNKFLNLINTSIKLSKVIFIKLIYLYYSFRLK